MNACGNLLKRIDQERPQQRRTFFTRGEAVAERFEIILSRWLESGDERSEEDEDRIIVEEEDKTDSRRE